MSITLRTKILSVVVATILVVLVAGMFAGLLDYPMDQTLVGAALIGFLVALVEVFYVGGHGGRWLRAMHPVASLLVYAVIVVCIGLVVMHVNHALFGRLDQLPGSYARLPVTLPLMFGLSVLAITTMRIIGFLGARNVVHLVLGTYHRPVLERRVFLFLDLRSSTDMVEALGPLRARALIGKFFFDISAPITDSGGEIYRFTGDGVVATWPWEAGIRDAAVLDAMDGISEAVDREAARYRADFDRVPRFRIGVHGGDIVVSEEGDTKRAIGFYGDTIHIAARMEQKAKELGVSTLLSGELVDAFTRQDRRLREIARETVRGISRPLAMYTLDEPAGERP